jgi:hypothetical protein
MLQWPPSIALRRVFDSLRHSKWWWLDAVWLLVLAVYVLAGMMLATFHGDEAMQIYMSRDYATAFIDRHPSSLMVNPPYAIDEDPWLRILNGSVNRYAIGLSWQVAGMNTGMLPPRPGWDWGLEYDTNVATGHLPSDGLLAVGRISSTLFLVMSVVAMFGIGWQFGGRLPAYIISGLYTLNPIILLNGRRAMMEGSMLGFGLLTIWLAILISRGKTRWYWWVLLTVSAGLTIASKHTGILFVGGALGGIGLVALVRYLFRQKSNYPEAEKNLISTFASLVLSGIAALFVFIALSPALWNNPPERLNDLIGQRQFLLDIQVASNPGGATTLAQRLEGIITQPFMTAPVHYEVEFWSKAAAIAAEIQQYMASPLSGLQFGIILGLPLTLLAGIGLLSIFLKRDHWVLIPWILVTLASLLANPLPWQRYYLPWLPAATVLAGVGFLTGFRFVQKRLQPQSPLVSSANVAQT